MNGSRQNACGELSTMQQVVVIERMRTRKGGTIGNETHSVGSLYSSERPFVLLMKFIIRLLELRWDSKSNRLGTLYVSST